MDDPFIYGAASRELGNRNKVGWRGRAPVQLGRHLCKFGIFAPVDAASYPFGEIISIGGVAHSSCEASEAAG